MRLIRLFKHDIAKEASEWVQEKIITVSQAEQICARYEVDYHDHERRSFGYWVLIILGYLFIGLSLIVLIGANWEDIPRAVRMAGLVSLTMATQLYALQKHRRGEEFPAVGLFFLGNLFYGASIALISQMYHLGAQMPDGILLWALGALPIGVILLSPLVMLQSFLLALLWFFLRIHAGEYPWLFLLFIAGALVVLYYGRQSIPLFLATVAGLTLWIEYTLAEFWRSSQFYVLEMEHVIVGAALFILMYAFSHWLHRRDSVRAKDYGAMLALWSLRLGLIYLIVMGFELPWYALISADWDHQHAMLGVVSLMILGALALAHQARKVPLFAVISTIFLVSLFLVLETQTHRAVFAIAYNILAIAAGVALIIEGINTGASHYFFLGVVTILLTAFLRYIDLIGDYLGGALLFFVIAIVLLGAAKFWKRHQDQGEAA